MESDWIAAKKIGASAGLTLRKGGGGGLFTGSCRAAAWIAPSTSIAAPSMLRSRSNWMVTDVLPSELCDVIEVTPGIVENWLSSGVATDDAIVEGSAPGRLAETKMVGKSTGGNSLTGKVE